MVVDKGCCGFDWEYDEGAELTKGGGVVMESDFEIPMDVLQEATSDIALKVPGGGDGNGCGKWDDPVIVQGSEVKRGGKLPEGKTVVEVSFRVGDNGTPGNAGTTFRQSFWMNNDSLTNKELLRNDMQTKISLRLLQNLAKVYGVDVTTGLLRAFSGMEPALLSGKAVQAKFVIKLDKNDNRQLNINGFATV